MGKMAELFLGKKGRIFFYFVMIIYLYGDLAIYAGECKRLLRFLHIPSSLSLTLISVSFAAIAMCYRLFVRLLAVSVPVTLNDYTGSFNLGSWHIGDPYYFFLVLFIIFVSPMCFMNFQVTVVSAGLHLSRWIPA